LQATNASSAQTDIVTDKSTTSSTSSHLAISELENLLGGSRDDSQVVSVTSKDEDALVQGHSEDDISLVAADRSRDKSTVTDDSDTRRNDIKEVTPEKRDFEDVPSPLRIIVEDVDAFVAEESNSTSQTVEMIDECGVRSRSKESHSVSECSSSVSGRTMSDSESESDSESDSEEEEEDEEEDDESRDENCNVKTEKKEEKKNDENYNDKDSTEREANEGSKNSSNSESDEETTVLSISSNTRGESSVTPDDRYERDLKRRSASIIDERSVEEMFDDNGWVVTEQDLELDLQNDLRTVSVIPLDFGSTIDLADRLAEEIADSIDDVNDAAGTRTEEIIPRIAEGRHDEMLSNLDDSSARSSTVDDAEMVPSSERGSEVPPRSHVYRQSSLGKNGWLVSDESESESDRTTSPIEASSGRDVARIESVSEVTGIEESTGDIDENGWVILDDDDDDDDKEHVKDSSAQESTIRSQTTDLVNSKTNGALVANVATRSKGTEQSSPGEHEETPGASMSIPMQMVTTVFCVSVLCYSVLTNLFP